MRISQVSSTGEYKNQTKKICNNAQSASNPLKSTANNTLQNAVYSCENIKANFLPSFQGYRTTGRTNIVDKDTGENVTADIKREKIGDFISLKLMVGKKEAGFLDMECNSVFPEHNYVLSQPYNSIPEIHHLRSLKGDEYSGIGTALIKTAIQESCNNGGFGNLWLNAEKGYAKTLSPYNSDENPIPFYYKIGFESPDKDLDAFIRNCIKNTRYYELPESALLLLTPEARDYWLEELISNPVIKFKEEPVIA